VAKVGTAARKAGAAVDRAAKRAARRLARKPAKRGRAQR
jgi:hypothetical protein